MLFNVLYNMIKPLLNDRVRDNIIFHGDNLSQLHEEVNPELLPAALGGTGDLDNTAAVAAAKKLDKHFKEHVDRALAVQKTE